MERLFFNLSYFLTQQIQCHAAQLLNIFKKMYHYPGEVQQYVSLNFSESIFYINVFMGAFEN